MKIVIVLAALLSGILLSCGPKEDALQPDPLQGLTSEDGFIPLSQTVTPTGCTKTIGYWKNHSEFGPAPYDSAWKKVRNGASTMFSGTGKTYIQVARMSSSGGNAYYILARQFIATKLNYYSGASVPREIFTAGTRAVELLRDYDGHPYAMSAIRGDIRKEFLNIAGLLGKYNEGLIGPGHCPDEYVVVPPPAGPGKNTDKSK